MYIVCTIPLLLFDTVPRTSLLQSRYCVGSLLLLSAASQWRFIEARRAEWGCVATYCICIHTLAVVIVVVFHHVLMLVAFVSPVWSTCTWNHGAAGVFFLWPSSYVSERYLNISVENAVKYGNDAETTYYFSAWIFSFDSLGPPWFKDFWGECMHIFFCLFVWSMVHGTCAMILEQFVWSAKCFFFCLG